MDEQYYTGFSAAPYPQQFLNDILRMQGDFNGVHDVSRFVSMILFVLLMTVTRIVTSITKLFGNIFKKLCNRISGFFNHGVVPNFHLGRSFSKVVFTS